MIRNLYVLDFIIKILGLYQFSLDLFQQANPISMKMNSSRITLFLQMLKKILFGYFYSR